MKISPMPAGGTPGQAIGSVEVGKTADSGKIARATAIAQGQTPQEAAPATESARPNVRALKMRTNYSTDRDLTALAEQATLEKQPEAAQSSISEVLETAPVEATQALSPQLAALAREKRALQLQRAEIDKVKAELEALKGSGADSLEQELKSNPLGTLNKLGITYDQLTQAVLENPHDLELQKLRQEMAQLKDGFNQTLAERDKAAEAQIKREIAMEAQRIISEGSDFETVREANAIPLVIELIDRNFRATGEVLDTTEALRLVEEELFKDYSSKFSKLSKIRNQIAPANQPQQQMAERQIRTLTNRDNATAPMSRRARAIAAMTGQLKR